MGAAQAAPSFLSLKIGEIKEKEAASVLVCKKYE